MPTYVYKFVDTGETIEVQQSFADDTLTEAAHPESGEVLPVKKVFQPVGVTFKGSGFFKTDNRGSSATTPSTAGATSADGGDSSSGSSDSSSGSSGGSGDTSSGTSGGSGDSSGSSSGSTASSGSGSTTSSSTAGSSKSSAD